MDKQILLNQLAMLEQKKLNMCTVNLGELLQTVMDDKTFPSTLMEITALQSVFKKELKVVEEEISALRKKLFS